MKGLCLKYFSLLDRHRFCFEDEVMHNNGWKEREVEGHPSGLVRAIGSYIFDYYE